MNKQDYLRNLSAALSTLVPDRERLEILHYYEEYFEDAGPEREAALIQELGDPVALAQKIAREGDFSVGTNEHAPKPSHRRRWAAGIAAAAVLILAGIFAALSARSAQSNRPGGDVPTPAPASPTLGTQNQPVEESQHPIQGSAALNDTVVRVNLDITLGDVSIRSGSDWGLSLESSGQNRHGEDYLLHYTLENEEPTIWSTPEQLDSDGSSNLAAQVVITVPEGWTLECIELDTIAGNLDLTGITADEIRVDTISGNVTAQRLSAGSFHSESISGSVSLDCLTTPGSVSLDSISGKLSYSGPLSSDTRLDSVSGGIEIAANNTAEECAYTLDSTSGRIRVDGVLFEPPAKKTTVRVPYPPTPPAAASP